MKHRTHFNLMHSEIIRKAVIFNDFLNKLMCKIQILTF